MTIYYVTSNETYNRDYKVEADSKEEAIKRVKEGLVDHPKDWTGLHGYHQLVMGKKVSGPWIDRTAYYHSLQRREGKLIREFISNQTIKLTPPPMWKDVSRTRVIVCYFLQNNQLN